MRKEPEVMKTVFKSCVLFFAFHVSLINGRNVLDTFTAAQNNIHWGCPFNPSDYASGTVGDTEISFTPSWGNEVQPLVLADEDELSDFILSMTAVHKQVLEVYEYNSLDNYIWFYRDFKSSYLDFANFYARYRPAFTARGDCIGLATMVLDHAAELLWQRWPSLASHSYLAAVRDDLTKSWDGNKEATWQKWKSSEHPDSEHVLMNTGIKHVLGVVKFEVQGRLGYMLLDPAWERPAVLMLDGKPPHDNIIGVRFCRLVLNNSYVSIRLSWRDREDNIYLVYLRRPYCSFLDTTEKVELVRTRRAIVRRDSNGNLVASAYIRTYALPGDPTETNSVWLRYLDTNRQTQGIIIPLRLLVPEKFNSLATGVQEWLMQWLTIVEDLLGLSSGMLLYRLRIVQAILTDEEFVENCKNTYAEYSKMST